MGQVVADRIERFTQAIEWVRCPRCNGEWNRLGPRGVCGGCEQEEENNQRHEKRLIEIMGERAFREYRFEKFLHLCESDAVVKGIAQSFDPYLQNLYFLGESGRGKTHLAMALLPKWFASLGGSVGWIQLSRFHNEHRDSRGMVPQAKIDAVAHKKLLVIDEVGIEDPTTTVIDLLYRLVDDRIRRGVNGLVITSNLDFDQLGDHYGSDRLPSRLAGLCGTGLVKFSGPDKRLMRAEQESQDAFAARKDLA